jgi:hypothetical protein
LKSAFGGQGQAPSDDYGQRHRHDEGRAGREPRHIAKSVTLAFKKDHDTGDAVDIIGQFGVGFYPPLCGGRRQVLSRAYGSEEAWLWESEGREGYTLTKAEKPTSARHYARD